MNTTRKRVTVSAFVAIALMSLAALLEREGDTNIPRLKGPTGPIPRIGQGLMSLDESFALHIPRLKGPIGAIPTECSA